MSAKRVINWVFMTAVAGIIGGAAWDGVKKVYEARITQQFVPGTPEFTPGISEQSYAPSYTASYDLTYAPSYDTTYKPTYRSNNFATHRK